MDRFDEIWKNRFNDEDLSVEGWNDPDPGGLEGVEVHLKKDSKRKAWWWFLLGAIVLAVIFSILSLSSSDAQMKKLPLSQKENQEASTEKEDAAFAETPISEKTVELNKVNSSKISKPQSLQVKESKIPIIEKISQNQFLDNSQGKPFFVEKDGGNQKFSLFEKDENIGENRSKLLTEVVPASNAEILTLFSLPKLSSILSTDEVIDFSLPEIREVIHPIKKPSRFFASLNTGAVLWQHRISEQYTSDLAPFDFNFTNNDFGWQTSLDGGLRIGKFFELKTSIRFEQIRVNSGHNSDINYDPNAESARLASNEYDLTLATPYGLSAAQFILNRSADVGTEAVALKVDFYSGHDIMNIQVPTTIRIYPFGKRQLFEFFAEAGASINFLTKVSNSIDEIETHHDAIQFNDNGQAFADPDIKKKFYDLQFGAGLNYRFSKNLKLNFSYDYSRGLNPVFEQQNYQTVIDRQHISLGLRKDF